MSLRVTVQSNMNLESVNQEGNLDLANLSQHAHQ
jgi:hypothetical protein